MHPALRRELSDLLLLSGAALWRSRRSAALAVGAGALALRWWRGGQWSPRGRVVVITGGSRGLGLALARRFMAEGARVALLARDARELERAAEKLTRWRPGQLMTWVADVTESGQWRQAIAAVEHGLGPIDLLVNNAGAIAVGPFELSTRDEFQAMLDLYVHAVVAGTRAVLPGFVRRGGGRIVNICSFGGRMAVPHMSAYGAGKFALAGLSQTLAAELAPRGVRVTTVYPGVMRVGSTMQAAFKGAPEREYAWFTSGSLVPGVAVSAETAARKIVAGVRAGATEVMFPGTTRLAVLAQAAFPEVFAAVQRGAARLLPEGTERRARTGAESRDYLDSRAWYRPLAGVTRRAEQRWNQTPRADAARNLGLRQREDAAPAPVAPGGSVNELAAKTDR